ncbi:uncharacterized protein LOC131240623 isoform X3 [Magnolia sinica]|uniref:uncharacterized protein LOC131240623 isoform X3 n=1 Tax=Magnolia sinica TaxID=86752 RepID=UPI00265B1EE9|nr:uncharacterized protein LOC131240623 isoform X3 [Magnolia sinica]
MAALKNYQNPLCLIHFHHPSSSSSSPSRKSIRLQSLHLTPESKLLVIRLSKKARVPQSIGHAEVNRSIRCFCQQIQANGQESIVAEGERPPFDLNLAVVLAGFAFEAYSSPSKDVGKREIDAADCQTVFLSELFVREVYDGQLFIKLKKGFDFPAMDPWGTSDPYVVIQFDGQVAKSKIKWATKEPIWNEDFTINIKKPPMKNLQVAAWDANLVTPHKRMGNAVVNLESFCDGNSHEVLVELEGMGGGGKVHLEQVMYKSFEDIDKEKQWWRIPIVSEFLMKNSFASALKKVLGSDSVQASEFVQFAFGQLRSLNYAYFQSDRFSNGDSHDMEGSGKSVNPIGDLSNQSSLQESRSEDSVDKLSFEKDNNPLKFGVDTDVRDNGSNSLLKMKSDDSMESDAYFWKNLADVINQAVVQKLGFSVPEKIKWDGFELLKNMSSVARTIAEAQYVESGLASPKVKDNDDATSDLQSTVNRHHSSLPDIKTASLDLLRQTDAIFGALMVLAATFSQQKKEAYSMEKNGSKRDASIMVDVSTGYSTNENVDSSLERSALDQKKAEEMKELFITAESAMEAWAMLATSLGRPSFIKSEFEKICFLDNPSTDTQVAIWRDSLRKRLVVAFRGTEQSRWKDLRTDLMLAPAGLNPERIGGDFNQEVQVHSGFLSAYDSVMNRIMSLIKISIGFVDDGLETMPKWHVYVTGHSLGGALATLLALELSSSQMAKCGAISVTMYNFGSPRVGNKRFAEVYNEKVKDSWRIVNHRDIIPTVPRLMGYCHVAQPVYLAAGDLEDALMKGEKELVEKILQAEINLFRSIRDGTALMQHMEDFYYITLLEILFSGILVIAWLSSVTGCLPDINPDIGLGLASKSYQTVYNNRFWDWLVNHNFTWDWDWLANHTKQSL